MDRFNQMWGHIDSQLTSRYDGVRFQRGLREPFIPLNEPGLPGSANIYPACLVEHNDELRIYSVGCRHWHGWHIGEHLKSKLRRPLPKGEGSSTAILMHTLRKDGFMYLASKGGWASFISKPVILADAVDVTMIADGQPIDTMLFDF